MQTIQTGHLALRLSKLTMLLVCAVAPLCAQADEKAELEALRATTLGLIKALVDQGLLTRERADVLLKQASKEGAKAAASGGAPPAWGDPPVAGKAVVRVPYLSETAKLEIESKVRDDVIARAKTEGWATPNTIPEWVNRIKVEGDVRVRYQGDFFDPDNVPATVYNSQTDTPAWWPDAKNTTVNRHRLALRARWGLTSQVNAQVRAAMRISTGTPNGAVSSTSATMGNYSSKPTIALDRAFMRYEPSKNLSLDAGRFDSPFVKTDLTWADDLMFDGLALTARAEPKPGSSVFAVAGAFPLKEFENSTQDKWLFGAQMGARLKITDGTQLSLALASYNFANLEGVREQGPRPNPTAPYLQSEYASQIRQKGNTLININMPGAVDDKGNALAPTWGLASKFRPLVLTGVVQIDEQLPFKIHLSCEYVKNLGFNYDDIVSRANVSGLNLQRKTTALQGRVDLFKGDLSKPGDWAAWGAMRRLEKDAWVDAFTDSSWHLGGTNYKGWALGGSYAIAPNAWLGFRWQNTRNLENGERTVNADGTQLDQLSSAPFKVEVIQLEINTRF